MLEKIRKYFDKKRAIAKALRCQGWTGRNKLSVLFDLADRTNHLEGDILEIGSAWGRSTTLLGYASDKEIWSIDPHTGGRAFIERGELQNSFNIFKTNLSSNGLDKRVRILKHTTADVIEKKLLPHAKTFSLAFIDGLHTAEGVRTDFDLSFERLVPSGVMVLDDYYEDSVPDYTSMIDQLVRMNGLNLIKDQSSRLVYFEKE